MLSQLGGASPPGSDLTPRLAFRLNPVAIRLLGITVAAQRQILTAFPIYFLRHRHRLRGSDIR